MRYWSSLAIPPLIKSSWNAVAFDGASHRFTGRYQSVSAALVCAIFLQLSAGNFTLSLSSGLFEPDFDTSRFFSRTLGRRSLGNLCEKNGQRARDTAEWQTFSMESALRTLCRIHDV